MLKLELGNKMGSTSFQVDQAEVQYEIHFFFINEQSAESRTEDKLSKQQGRNYILAQLRLKHTKKENELH